MDILQFSNGKLSATLDPNGQINRICYPNISNGNHVGMTHKIGVFIEGNIHWIDDGSWIITQDFHSYPPIGKTTIENKQLQIRLEFLDMIDHELNILSRNIEIINLSDQQRQIKIFMYQSFNINDENRKWDSVQKIPKGSLGNLNYSAILHSGKGFSFLVSANNQNNIEFDEYTVGKFGNYDGSYMSGSWFDACDGALSKNNSDVGQTDSVIGFTMDISPRDSYNIDYALSVATDNTASAKSLAKFWNEGSSSRSSRCCEYWQFWQEPAVKKVESKLNEKELSEFEKSLLLTKNLINTNGGVTTNNTGEIQTIYQSKIAYILSELNLDQNSVKAFNFLSEHIERDGFLLPSYYDNGTAVACGFPWLNINGNVIKPIRLVDNAQTLINLCQSINKLSADKSLPNEWKKLWKKIGIPLADFLSDYIDPTTKLPLPSYTFFELKATKFDALLVDKALRMATNIAEKMKDTDKAVKYQATLNDMLDSEYKLSDNLKFEDSINNASKQIQQLINATQKITGTE